MGEENIILRATLWYRKFGLSVIPCGRDKKPLIPWLEFQKRIATEGEIGEWWRNWYDVNVGIVTGAVSGLVVIDIDQMDLGEPALQGILGDAVCPTCQTPGGGQHLYFKASIPVPPNNTRLIPGCDFRGEGGFVVAPPSVGDAGEYVWLPGLGLHETALLELPGAYLDAIRAATATKIAQEATGQPILTEGRRNADIFSLGYNLVLGGMLPDRALDHVLHEAKTSTPPYSEAEARRTFASALERAKKGPAQERSVAEDVERLIEEGFREGVFKASWVTEGLHQASGLQKASEGFKRLQRQVQQSLRRLKDRGFIEPSRKMAGEYRRVDKDLTPIEFLKAPGTRLDIRFPFEIERMVHTYPKNVIVVAGEPDAGKTAFLLNVVRLNQDRFPIHY